MRLACPWGGAQSIPPSGKTDGCAQGGYLAYTLEGACHRATCLGSSLEGARPSSEPWASSVPPRLKGASFLPADALFPLHEKGVLVSRWENAEKSEKGM